MANCRRAYQARCSFVLAVVFWLWNGDTACDPFDTWNFTRTRDVRWRGVITGLCIAWRTSTTWELRHGVHSQYVYCAKVPLAHPLAPLTRLLATYVQLDSLARSEPRLLARSLACPLVGRRDIWWLPLRNIISSTVNSMSQRWTMQLYIFPGSLAMIVAMMNLLALNIRTFYSRRGQCQISINSCEVLLR